MGYCLNPHCLKPQNSFSTKFCSNCQTPLLLDKRYRAIEIIGRGGMGRTFLAVDEKNQLSQSRRVIKQFFPKTTNNRQRAIELFAAEAVSLDELGRHPQIPQLYDYLTQDEHQYLIQEWIEGDNLARVLEKKGTFDEPAIYRLLNDLLAVLAFVHQHQIIHRDVKPENIIRRLDGTLVLVDFGAAKALSSQAIHQTGTIIGSPEYVAPEQLRGKAVFSSDLYSLGVTCLYLLTGISPFDLYSDSEDAWVWRDYLAGDRFGTELGQILDKMVVRATAKRYPSAEAVLQDLNAKSFVSLELVNSREQAENSPNASDKLVLSQSVIDCTHLQNLLVAQQWQRANQVTEEILLEVADRNKKGWLELDDLEKLTCEDLGIIDRLWRDCSAAHFSFSVQHDIWQSLQTKNYRNFGQQVGWHRDGRWILTKQINFSLAAPRGHLPAISWWFGHAIWGLKGLFGKIDTCARQKNFPCAEDKNQIIL